MLHVFYGSDVIGVREKAHAFLHTYEAKGVETVRITPETFSEGVLEDHAGASSLFGGEQVIVIDTPSGDIEMFEQVFNSLDLLSESGNTFVLIEEVLLAPQKKKLGKFAQDVTELTAQKKERFNTFSLTDALLRKDKKSLWMLLLAARREGISEEEIIGVLYWQIKALRLVAHSKNVAGTGLKPFVYQKTQRALTKFKEGEPDSMSCELLSIYHDGHLGVRDIDISLEKWVLSM